jgi:predicted DNA-binding transcriptional regulator YafY
MTPAKNAPGFSLENYLSDGRAHFGNGRSLLLNAQINHQIADLLAEAPISSDQYLEYQEDYANLTATVADNWQLRWWLMSQGEHLLVLGPEELQTEMRRANSNLAQKYDKISAQN